MISCQKGEAGSNAPLSAEHAFLLAPAKLNLGLSIVGRRADGYHELESLFWPLSFADEVRIREATEDCVTMEWAQDAPRRDQALPSTEENLVWKALKAIPRTRRKPLQVEVSKRVPLGAGLGGGSSDAAALLRYFGAHLGVPTADLFPIATRLGADVPFFLQLGAAWVTGIGEKRQYLLLKEDVASVAFLLVLLPEPIATKPVFETYRDGGRPFSALSGPPPSPLDAAGLRAFLTSRSNDLEIAASRHCDLIAPVLARLRKTRCWYAGLSGSGSTCFAVFGSTFDREETIKELTPFLRQYHCKSISADTCTSI